MTSASIERICKVQQLLESQSFLIFEQIKCGFRAWYRFSPRGTTHRWNCLWKLLLISYFCNLHCLFLPFWGENYIRPHKWKWNQWWVMRPSYAAAARAKNCIVSSLEEKQLNITLEMLKWYAKPVRKQSRPARGKHRRKEKVNINLP